MAKRKKEEGTETTTSVSEVSEVIGLAEPEGNKGSEERKLLAPETMEYLLEHGGKIWKQILSSLGYAVNQENGGSVPEEKRLRRDSEGFIAREEVETGISRYESEHGEGSAAWPLTKEAQEYHQREKLWNRFPYNKVLELTGKMGGVTLEELKTVVANEAAEVEKEAAERAEYHQKIELRDDGEPAQCGRCKHTFQPKTLILLKDGKPRLTQRGEKIRVGSFFNPDTRGADEEFLERVKNLLGMPFCVPCQKDLRNSGGQRIRFAPREFVARRKERVEFDLGILGVASETQQRREHKNKPIRWNSGDGRLNQPRMRPRDERRNRSDYGRSDDE